MINKLYLALFFLVLSHPVFAGTIMQTFSNSTGIVTVSSNSAPPNGTSFSNIQHKSCNTSSSTGTCGYPSNITAHSLLVVGCIGSAIAAGANTFLVTDNNGNTYSTATVKSTSNGAGTKEVGVYYTLNANAGATTVTCQDQSGAASFIQEAIHEYGSTGLGAFDIATSSSPTASLINPSATSLTTSINNEFVFAYAANFGGTITGESGTLRENYVNNAFQGSEDTVVSVSQTSYQSTFTAATGNWVMIQASFK